MLQGKSLQELASEVHRQSAARRDFICPASELTLPPTPDPSVSLMRVGEVGEFAMEPRAHRQLGTHLGVPAKFYQRLSAEHPDLHRSLINGLLLRDDSKRMVRTLDGRARALLSDRYRRRDNLEILETVLPALQSLDTEVVVRSSEVTTQRLYLKVTLPRIKGEVKRGDVVTSGFMVTNSEVGEGSTSIKAFVERLVCANGLIVPEYTLKSAHLGRRIGGETSHEIYSSEAMEADDKAYMLMVRDAIVAIASESIFEKALNRFRDAADQRVEKRPDKAIEELANAYQLREKEHESILDHFIRSGDLSRWGLANAVTRAANDLDDYDRSTELQAMGGRIIDLPAKDWQVIASH